MKTWTSKKTSGCSLMTKTLQTMLELIKITQRRKIRQMKKVLQRTRKRSRIQKTKSLGPTWKSKTTAYLVS